MVLVVTKMAQPAILEGCEVIIIIIIIRMLYQCHDTVNEFRHKYTMRS